MTEAVIHSKKGNAALASTFKCGKPFSIKVISAGTNTFFIIVYDHYHLHFFKVTPLPMECDPNGVDLIFQLGHIPIYIVATAGPYEEDAVDEINEFYHLILKINLNVKKNLTAELSVSYNTVINLTTITNNVC